MSRAPQQKPAVEVKAGDAENAPPGPFPFFLERRIFKHVREDQLPFQRRGWAEFPLGTLRHAVCAARAAENRVRKLHVHTGPGRYASPGPDFFQRFGQ